jgi:hypothetical protein
MIGSITVFLIKLTRLRRASYKKRNLHGKKPLER